MAKSDAPNYRKATTNKKCGNCKAWDSSKTDDPMTGYCEWYDFNCRADHTCDAWAPDDFEKAWEIIRSDEKGKFRGYSKNTIEGRAERQGKARAWNKARKVKRGRTRLRYARNKTRGNVRPKMRRQLGAGGKRESVSR